MPYLLSFLEGMFFSLYRK